MKALLLLQKEFIMKKISLARLFFSFQQLFIPGLLLTVLFNPQHSFAALESNCDQINYADEFNLTNFIIISSTSLADDMEEVTISADMINNYEAELKFTIATPDFSASDLGVLINDPSFQAYEFSTVAAYESKSSTDASSTSMTLRLPTANLNELVNQLNAGNIPFFISGEETLVLQPGTLSFRWSGLFLQYFEGQEPTGGWEFLINPLVEDMQDSFAQMNWTYIEARPGTSDSNQCIARPGIGETWHVYEGPNSGIVPDDHPFPVNLRFGTIDKLVIDVPSSVKDESDCATGAIGLTALKISPLNAETWDPQESIRKGAFCSGASLDQPVARSRFIADPLELDDFPETPLSDNDKKYVQPFRLNNLSIGGLNISGQVQGFGLKSGMNLRIRSNGDLIIGSTIESDFNMAIQATAEKDVNLLNQHDISLGELCFPLPPLPLGFINLPMSLHLTHDLDVEASVKAGVTVGLEKQFSGGYSLSWDTGKSDNKLSSQTIRHTKPLDLTPPRLSDDTAADVRVAANFRTAIKFADYSTFCAGGLGPYFNASLVATMHASPTEDPWWNLGHEAQLSAGFNFDFLGLSIIDQSTPLLTFIGDETQSGLRSDFIAPTSHPTSGIDQRWAINIEDFQSDAGRMLRSDIAATADNGAVVVSSADQLYSDRIMRIDAQGQLIWDKNLGITRHIWATEVLADGKVMVAGRNGSKTQMWLAQHASDGSILWNRKFQLQTASGSSCALSELSAFIDQQGGQGYILSGTSGHSTNHTYRPCLLRLDADGNPLWSRVMELSLNTEQNEIANWQLNDLIPTRDGGFLFVGSVYNRVIGLSTPATTLPVAVKMDADGNALWHVLFNIPTNEHRAGRLFAAAQADDGSFYFTGSVGGTIREVGGLLVATMSEDGSEGKGAILFHGSNDEIDPNHLSEDYGDIGVSAYDRGFDIVAVKGGAILVGSLGTINMTNGLGDQAWIIRVNERLGVEWFNSYDGIDRESFTRLSKTANGVLAVGTTQSVITNDPFDGKATLMVMKLPFEGMISKIKPEFDIYQRYELPTVYPGPGNYEMNPIILPVKYDDPYLLVDGNVTDHGSEDNLLKTPDPLCVIRLTPDAGIDSPLYLCDRDEDGIAEPTDNCPLTPNPEQSDLDNDGQGDACDLDVDGDDLSDIDEAIYGLDETKKDSDGDGLEDSVEVALFSDYYSIAFDGDLDGDLIRNIDDDDIDGDNESDLQELARGTDPADAGSIPTALVLYDDFSSPNLDPVKWFAGQYGTEVAAGNLRMFVKSSGVYKQYANLQSKNDLKIKTTIMITDLNKNMGDDEDWLSYRVQSRPYSTGSGPNTVTGRVFASLHIGDRGNGLEVWYLITREINDNGDSEDVDTGVVADHNSGLSLHTVYQLEIVYDGVNQFIFSLYDDSGNPIGLPVTANGPALGSLIDNYPHLRVKSPSGGGRIDVAVTKVETGNDSYTIYDDFSNSSLDPVKWREPEVAKEVDNGRAKLLAHTFGNNRYTTSFEFAQYYPYVEAELVIDPSSWQASAEGSSQFAYVSMYNESRGPGSGQSYNGIEGDWEANVMVNRNANETNPHASTLMARYPGPTWDDYDTVAYEPFDLSISTAAKYKLFIGFSGDFIVAGIENVTTGDIDATIEPVSATQYLPANLFTALLSRIYGGDGGAKHLSYFDNVYVSGDPLFTRGDVNLDSNVDLQDAIESIRAMTGSNGSPVWFHGDMNNDGAIGIPEAIGILNYLSIE